MSKISMLSGVARPWEADGGDGINIWRIVANILNEQLRIADKGLSSNLRVERVVSSS
jgi:hypothetical protein